MHLYIDLNTFPIEYIDRVINQYYTSNIIFKYKDEVTLKRIFEIYNTLKKKSVINIICDDSSINIFLYNHNNYQINHIVNIYPKNYNVYANILQAMIKTNSKFLIVNRVFNLSTDYKQLIEYLEANKNPVYDIYGIDEESIYNFKQLVEFTRNKKTLLKKPTNIYGYYDTYEVIYDESIKYKNINTGEIKYIPIQIYPLSNDKYLLTQINHTNYEFYTVNKHEITEIYLQLQHIYLNARLL